MANKAQSNIDLNYMQLLNLILQKLSIQPSNPREGQIYYDTTQKYLMFYNGTEWKRCNQLTINEVPDLSTLYLSTSLLGIEGGVAPLGTGGKINNSYLSIDTELSEYSNNVVANSVVTSKLNEIDTSNFQVMSEKGQPNGYCPLDENAIVPEQHLPETVANKDLSNLTSFGNTRLYYQPFAINSGTVDANGENATLDAPGSGTVIQTFVQPTLTSDGTMGVSDFACTSDYGTAYYAFDGNAETYAGIYGGNTLGCTVTFYNKNPLNITNLVIDGYQNLVTVAYSDDNDSWIQCANVSGSLGSSTVVNITNDIGYHNYYRVSIRNTAGTTNAILHQIHITATEEVLVSTADTIYCDTCICTTADGRTKEFTTTSSLDVSEVADGNYSILKDYTTGALSLANQTISPKEPTSPSSGDYWLDNSQLPLVLKNYSNSEWVTDNSKILLGKCIISSGVVTALTNKSFNQLYAYSGNISSYSMPSTKYIDLTLGASGSTYTAPANGWFLLAKTAGSDFYYAALTVVNGLRDFREAYRTSDLTPCIAVRKGDTVQVEYNATGATRYFRFIYAEGEV